MWLERSMVIGRFGVQAATWADWQVDKIGAGAATDRAEETICVECSPFRNPVVFTNTLRG